MSTIPYVNKLKALNKSLHLEYMLGAYPHSDIFSDLIEEKKYLEVADIYELIGLNCLNIYSLDNFKNINADMFYINSRSLNISCLYHYTFGDKEYAKTLAKINYEKHHKYYLELLNPNSLIPIGYKDGSYVAHDLELLGDICMFFDNKLSEKHYMRAIELYKTSDVYDAEWYLGIDLNYEEALRICFDFDARGNMPDRITYKMKLYEIIK
ncbi:hypothetical protein [Vallitalea sp.]|jgi:hypothetical protein|uniref:hypothetical protein n=1 Tax=Vallitalea sp. TaxID=1882829 RepID=UPI0025E7179F|nr:hypothetical protein [Vallitalea sp.]MCT4688376.1 hypothetical protein [Vallitalea sp.]